MQLCIAKDAFQIDGIIVLFALGALNCWIFYLLNNFQDSFAHDAGIGVDRIGVCAYGANIFLFMIDDRHSLEMLFESDFAFGARVNIFADSWVAIFANPSTVTQHYLYINTWMLLI